MGGFTVQELATSLSGALIEPGHPDYDRVRGVQNGLIDKRPALIVRCQNTADVVDAVRFGRDQGLELSCRAGGHNVAGHAVTDGGLMIDLSPMKAVLVDPTAKRARCQPGATWREFNRETQLHGLATTGGVVSSTGVSGLTLGGGLGWLMGKYGLAADNLLGAEIVTAEGHVLWLSEAENAELFWGIRGGGGNFGVVTLLEFALHEVGPTLVGGLVAHAFDAAGDVLAYFRELTTSGLPDELTIFGGLNHSPDGSGERLAFIALCHCGPVDEALEAIRPIKAFGSPVIDTMGPISYADQNTMQDAGFPRGALNYWKSNFVRQPTDEDIAVLVARFDACPSIMTGMILEHQHGAMSRVPASATAFPHRFEGYNLLVLGEWLEAGESEANIAWVRGTYDAMASFSARGAYSNYMTEDEGAARVRDAYGDNFARLQALKKRWDPDNVFHLNQNVPPA